LCCAQAFFLFLQLLRCFTSLSSLHTVNIPTKARNLAAWCRLRRQVSPFGNPRLITVCATSPRLIAGSHVLHRLFAPRHSSSALYYFFRSEGSRILDPWSEYDLLFYPDFKERSQIATHRASYDLTLPQYNSFQLILTTSRSRWSVVYVATLSELNSEALGGVYRT
jgi:hypothetical protein